MKYVFIKTGTSNMYSKISMPLAKLEEYGYSKKEQLQLITDFSYLVCDNELNIIEKHSDYIKPDLMPNAFTMEHNGITPESLNKSKSFEESEIGISFKKLITEEDITIIGHNIDFDIEMLKAVDCNLNKVNKIDTLNLSKRYVREDNNRLEYLFYATNIYTHSLKFINDNKLYMLSPNGRKITDFSLIKKSSMFNCVKTYLLLDYIMVSNKIKLKDITDIANTVVTLNEMPFGKHKGKKISLLEDAYILYLCKTPIEDKNLKVTFNAEIEKRGGLKVMLDGLNIYSLENFLKDTTDVDEEFLTLAQEALEVKIEKQLSFSFGKHSGEHIKDVLEQDPGYIDFMKDNKKLNKYMLTYIEG